jgi:hypothetical protein
MLVLAAERPRKFLGVPVDDAFLPFGAPGDA